MDHAATAVQARPEDETMPFGKLLVYGTQHILTMYGGLIAPPLIVGGAACAPTCSRRRSRRCSAGSSLRSRRRCSAVRGW
jgi:hypothetical protein